MKISKYVKFCICYKLVAKAEGQGFNISHEQDQLHYQYYLSPWSYQFKKTTVVFKREQNLFSKKGDLASKTSKIN